MRKLAGRVLLLAGVGVLGYVGATQNAVRMQAAITENASVITQAALHPIEAAVSGRDVVATGLVTDQTELAVLEATFAGIEGVRTVDVSGVETLPVASPFAITAARNVDGETTLSGAIPTQATRDELAGLAGDTAAGLILSAGVPDRDWAGVVAQGLSALALLKSGEVTVSDQSIMLRGLAMSPTERDAARAHLDALPDGYSLSREIEVEDDGTPLRLSLSLNDGAVEARGKFPADLEASEVAQQFSGADYSGIAQATISAADPQWPIMTRTAMSALAELVEGSLTIDGSDATLTGSGTPEGIARAAATIAGLPDAFTSITDLRLWDDGTPNTLTMNWDGATATASGKYPANFILNGPDGATLEDTGTNSFIDDEANAFAANANAGVAALGVMTSGTLVATETSITLTGEAASPRVSAALDDALSGVAEGTEISRDVTYLDDGSPAAWSLIYDAATGAIINGRLPNGLDTSTVEQTLGVAQLAGTAATAFEDDDIGSSLESLEILSGYLSEVETISYLRDSNGSALDLVFSPGVNVDLVATELAERLPGDVSLSLIVMDPPPENGTIRTNALSGLDEVFSNGYWLPSLSFTADVVECDAQTLKVFERGEIGFLSSSARFNATSTGAVNALAAVALACVDAGLTLEVGGHTDSTGSVLANEVLSANRANSVRTALIERGVPADAMTAFGYGQTEPVGDNGTAEGRAANRRTDITWFAAGAADNQ